VDSQSLPVPAASGIEIFQCQARASPAVQRVRIGRIRWFTGLRISKTTAGPLLRRKLAIRLAQKYRFLSLSIGKWAGLSQYRPGYVFQPGFSHINNVPAKASDANKSQSLTNFNVRHAAEA